jgi:hypothetical protein
VQFLAQRETGEFVGFEVVDCFGKEEEGAYYGEGGKGCLQPEDYAPGGEGYDYASYKGAECWAWTESVLVIQWM